MDGEMLAFDPPRLMELRWGEDVLRFELEPDGEDATLLTLCGHDRRARQGGARRRRLARLPCGARRPARRRRRFGAVRGALARRASRVRRALRPRRGDDRTAAGVGGRARVGGRAAAPVARAASGRARHHRRRRAAVHDVDRRDEERGRVQQRDGDRRADRGGHVGSRGPSAAGRPRTARERAIAWPESSVSWTPTTPIRISTPSSSCGASSPTASPNGTLVNDDEADARSDEPRVRRARAEDHHDAEDPGDRDTEELEQEQPAEQELPRAVAGEDQPLVDGTRGHRDEDRGARDRERHRDPAGRDRVARSGSPRRRRTPAAARSAARARSRAAPARAPSSRP